MNTRTQLGELGRHWTPPAGLDRSRPRMVSLTVSGKALLALAVALGLSAMAAGGGLGAIAARQTEESRLLQRDSMVTEGRITKLWRSSGEDKQPWVAYRFIRQGRAYDQNAKIPLRVWKDLRVGSDLPVHYVPFRPDLNYPFDFSKKPMPLWIPFVVAVGLAAGSFLATLPVRRERRLLADGRAAPGLVTHYGKAEHGSHGAELGRKYYYVFPLLSGAIAKGQAGPIKNPPAIGSTITVLYDPDNPHRNAPHPFSMVKLTHLQMH